MPRIFIVLFFTILLSPAVRAACTLASGQPTTLNIAAQLITLSADAPIDTSTPIAQYDSNTLGTEIKYITCLPTEEIGRRAFNLSGPDSSTYIYDTNISGIGIKITYYNGAAYGNIPMTTTIPVPSGYPTASMSIPVGTYYRIQLFKTGNLSLSNTAGDIAVPSGLLAYYYLDSDSPSNAITSVYTGGISIISTPVCTVDGAKTINFNTVTPTLLSAGVERALDFAIVCQSDYGTYSATASMTTTTASSDASYIQVEDAAGNMDRLGIRITDSNGQAIKVDGSSSEVKNSITSQSSADFTWKATLIAGNSASPTAGQFTAKAEIVFDIE